MGGRSRRGGRTAAVPAPGNLIWKPARIGPGFAWLDHDHIRVEDGPLAGRSFECVTRIEPKKASLELTAEGRRAGQVLLDREPEGEGVILWDIGVHPELRRRGLASVMTWCVFRELLMMQETASFRIRMVTLIKPGDKVTEVKNVGIGVVANRLGFTADFDVERLLRLQNITETKVIESGGSVDSGESPPGLKIVLKTYPLVLIGFVLDPDTHLPLRDTRLYCRLEQDWSEIRSWARQGRLVLSNGDYSLRADGVARFVNRIAVDPEEAERFLRRIKPIPPVQSNGRRR